MTAVDEPTVVPVLLLTVKQTTVMLSMSRAKLYELTVRGEIRSVKIDGMRRYHIRDLEAYAEQVRAS